MKYLVILVCAVSGAIIIRYTTFDNLDLKYWNQFWYFVSEGVIFEVFYHDPDAMIRLVKSNAFLKSIAGFFSGGFVGWLMFFADQFEEEKS